jgi:hypothetical protein
LAQIRQRLAQVAEGAGDAASVADLLQDRDGALVVVEALRPQTLRVAGAADVCQRQTFGMPIAGILSIIRGDACPA